MAALAVAGSTMVGLSPAPAGTPGESPVADTPHLAQGSVIQQVRQLARCGSTVYAVGAITQIAKGTKTYHRHGGFSFSAKPPYAVTSWNPKADGPVNTIAFAKGDCRHAYIGGQFSKVGATAAKNIAKVRTTSGKVVAGFRSNASAKVSTIASVGGHLLVGGNFTRINGSGAAPYLASLNPKTGKNDHYVALHISGHYVFTDAYGAHSVGNPTRVYHQQISPDGTRDLLEGDFTTIGGKSRRQVAMIDLRAHRAVTDRWHAKEFNANCKVNQPMYVQDGSWSRDGRTVYFAATGSKPAVGPGHAVHEPRAGLCDSASAFPAARRSVTHRWINYTGCDSLYATVAGASTVYFSGHERWASNPDGCDEAGPGSVPVRGVFGVSPDDGSVVSNQTVDRGYGADDLLLSKAGLWVASDTAYGSNHCGEIQDHAGICFFPNVS
jgi:hypothetical protein